MIKRCLKILSIVSVLLVGAFSASAVRPPIPEISVSLQSVSFTADGGSKSVTVTAKNMTWSIVTAPAAWVTATKTAAGVQIRASKNSSTSSRSTSITLGQGKTTCKVTITQKGASPKPQPQPEISVSPKNLTFAADGGSETVSVTAKNISWSILSSDAIPWYEIVKSGNSLTITAEKNSSTSSRSTSITLGQGKTTCEVTISQAGAKPAPPKPTLQVSETDVVADSQGEDRYITVDANGANWNVIGYPDSWVGISGKTADGLRLKIEKNPNLTERTTSLTIGNSKDRREIAIRQEAGYQFTVKNPEMTARADGEVLTVNVDARNFYWNVIDYPAEWVAVAGKTDGELRLKIDPNQSENSRSTSLTIGNGKKKTSVRIKQNGDKPVETFTVNGVPFEMVRVDGGSFMMGSNDGDSDEKPVHRETVSTFYIGRTEVTQALWEAVMGSNPSNYKGANLPVERVSWDDCQEFIRKLNQLTGRNFRLPSEAEWEYAARGGNRSQGYKYSGSNDLDRVGWYDDNSGDKTHPVASKQANELGLYDMSGNVWEWTSDKWSSNYDSPRNDGSSGSFRVDRGGGCNGGATYCRSANRDYDTPGNRCSYLGFRLGL